jgi:hypothetical protein
MAFTSPEYSIRISGTRTRILSEIEARQSHVDQGDISKGAEFLRVAMAVLAQLGRYCHLPPCRDPVEVSTRM